MLILIPCISKSIYILIIKTDIFSIVSEQKTSPCYLCARMRRGYLYHEAKKLGCNKIALGHHFDDVIETFMLNLFFEGRIGAFSPVTYLSRKDITMIRPLIHLTENDVELAIKRLNLPVVKSKCPADGTTERQEVKEFLNSLEKKYGNVREKILGAMQRKEINGY